MKDNEIFILRLDTKLELHHRISLYEGLKRAIQAGIPKSKISFVIDPLTSREILDDANRFELNYVLAHSTFYEIEIESNLKGLKNILEKKEFTPNDFILSVSLTPTLDEQKEFKQEIKRFEHEVGPHVYQDLVDTLIETKAIPKFLCIKGFERIDDYRETATYCHSKKIKLLLESHNEDLKSFYKKISLAGKVSDFYGLVFGPGFYKDIVLQLGKSAITLNEASDLLAQTMKSHFNYWNESRN